MKVVYVLRNPGLARRTPEGWQSALIPARAEADYGAEELGEIAEADVLVVGLDPVTAEMLACAPRLRLVQRLGVGYDNIDLVAAARQRVPVCNLPDFNAETVAEHTLMLILALQRRVFDATLLMKASQWPLSTIVGRGVFELRGKTLGLIGLGAIGQAVAKRARAFDVEILYFDKRQLSPEAEAELGVSFSSLESLLMDSDIVSLHVPLTAETNHFIGAAELGRMKPTALLINTARGVLVDENALAEMLEQGRLAGAGLDVFEQEPLPPRHPLRRCPNVLLTPHSAGQTHEAMERMVALLTENLARVANGQVPLHRII